MMNLVTLVLIILSAFLIGSLPTAYLMGKLGKGIDIRKHGSGNVGATNTFRVMGKIPGIIVLLIDILKGGLAVWLLPICFGGTSYKEEVWLLPLIGFIAIAGHICTPFLKFKGGKGVATSLGVFLFLDWPSAVVALVVWVIVAALSRYVSVASMAAAIALPISMVVFIRPFFYVLMASLLCLIICFKHKANVQRLQTGREKRIGEK